MVLTLSNGRTHGPELTPVAARSADRARHVWFQREGIFRDPARTGDDSPGRILRVVCRRRLVYLWPPVIAGAAPHPGPDLRFYMRERHTAILPGRWNLTRALR